MTTLVLEETPEVRDARRDAMLELLDKGWTRAQVADKYRISRQRVAQIVGKLPHRGKRQEIHIYTLPEAFKTVSQMALERGLRHRAGQTAGQGSVGLLIEQIAEGNLVITEPENVCAKLETAD